MRTGRCPARVGSPRPRNASEVRLLSTPSAAWPAWWAESCLRVRLLADRNFFSFADWCTAGDAGADLLWRLGEGIALPLVRMLGDGSYLSLVFPARIRRPERDRILAAARAGRDIDADKARLV